MLQVRLIQDPREPLTRAEYAALTLPQLKARFKQGVEHTADVLGVSVPYFRRRYAREIKEMEAGEVEAWGKLRALIESQAVE